MAFLDETGLTRLWNKIEGKFSQFSGNIENTYTKPNTDGNLVLYVSKQGSDNNDGLTQQTPLLTIEKAFEIAGKNLPLNIEGILSLCVGPGEWGNLTIGAKPYIIRLYAYTYTNLITNIADINQLPNFTSFSSRTQIQIYNANIDLFIVYDSSYAFFGNGLIVIGQAQAKYGSVLFIGSSSQAQIYIKNTNQSNVFYTEYDGTIIFPVNGRTITVYESLNLSSAFFHSYRQGKIIGLYSTQFNLATGVTVTGKKAIVGNNSVLANINYTNDLELSNIPGSMSPQFESGAIIDGASQGNTTQIGNKTFTGTIISSNNATLRRNDSTGFLQLGFTTVLNGGRLNLFGKDYTSDPGSFALMTGDGTNAKTLKGTTAGVLSWDGNISITPSGETWLNAAQVNKAALSTSYSGHCAIFNAPTKNNRIALSTYSTNDDNVYLYSVSNDQVTNSRKHSFVWNAESGNASFDGVLTINHNSMGTSSTPGILLTGTSTNFFLNAVNTSVTKGTAPGSNMYWGLNCYGKDYDNYNKRIAMFEGGLTSGNVSLAAIRAYNCTTNTNTGHCSIECHVDASGNAYTTAPTPAVADNSTKIATTAWVRTATGNLTANAANVTGTVGIDHGGTGQTTRLNALKALTNENVGTSATYFLTITNSWGKGGYSSTANAKTVLGISGSDRRIKDDINDISENILDAWENVDWKQFKMKKDVRLLGENAKLHFGAVVQDIQSVFSNSDIDSSKYGFLYQEDYPEEERDLPSDENSEVTNGDKWYLKYEEALCIEAAYQRRRADKLEKELNALKEQVKELFTRLS